MKKYLLISIGKEEGASLIMYRLPLGLWTVGLWTNTLCHLCSVHWKHSEELTYRRGCSGLKGRINFITWEGNIRDFSLSLSSGRYSFSESWGSLYLSLQNSAFCVLALVTEETRGEPRSDPDDKRSIVKAVSPAPWKKAKTKYFHLSRDQIPWSQDGIWASLK